MIAPVIVRRQPSCRDEKIGEFETESPYLLISRPPIRSLENDMLCCTIILETIDATSKKNCSKENYSKENCSGYIGQHWATVSEQGLDNRFGMGAWFDGGSIGEGV